MRRTTIVAAAALAAALALDARTVTTLEDGWTADGAAVRLPHTWNLLDATDGRDVPPRKSPLWN